MIEWYIYVIFILGAAIMFAGSGWYIIWQTDREISGKVLITMRTLSGDEDDFLAYVHESFITIPDKKNVQLQQMAKAAGVKRKEVDVKYIFDDRATTNKKYPSKKGLLSFLSRPVKGITYNEGDPNPLPRISIDEFGEIRRSKPLDSPTAVAIASDLATASGLGMYQEELDRERRKTAQIATKFINPIWFFVNMAMTLALIGYMVYISMAHEENLKMIREGLGI